MVNVYENEKILWRTLHAESPKRIFLFRNRAPWTSFVMSSYLRASQGATIGAPHITPGRGNSESFFAKTFSFKLGNRRKRYEELIIIPNSNSRVIRGDTKKLHTKKISSREIPACSTDWYNDTNRYNKKSREKDRQKKKE